MLQELITQFPNRESVVVKAVLDLPEDGFKVNVFYCRIGLECFVDNVKSKKRGAGVLVSESFDQLGKDEASLVPPDHRQEDFSCDLLEIRFVGLQFLQEIILSGK